MFRCKKTFLQADLRLDLRKFVFQLVPLRLSTPGKYRNRNFFYWVLKKLEMPVMTNSKAKHGGCNASIDD